MTSLNLVASEFEPASFWENYLADDSNGGEPISTKSSHSFLKQWFTGPLLVPSPITMPVKHPAFEPTVTVTDTYGVYKKNWKIQNLENKIWTVQYLGYWQMGFSKHVGGEVLAALNTNYSRKANSTHFIDSIARIGYQILTDKKTKGDYTPNLRVIFQETFPTGNYQKLNPGKQGADLTGQGSFQTGIYLAIEKGFNYNTKHAFNLYGAFGYFVLANFKVKGESLYGGNRFTNGKVHPGNMISAYISGELEITKRIAFAFASNYQQNLSGSFRGNMGTGTPVDVF